MFSITAAQMFGSVKRISAQYLNFSPPSLAKRRLADEYDAAQERGEVGKAGNSSSREELVSAADIGLTHKDIHEARQIRDAEENDPGIICRTLDAAYPRQRNQSNR